MMASALTRRPWREGVSINEAVELAVKAWTVPGRQVTPRFKK
jgi:hypothetical protein